jgi:tetratricopeptide (TPR) repeat protein
MGEEMPLPPEAEKAFVKAQKALDDGNEKGAMSEFNKAIKAAPEFADAYFGRAEAAVLNPKAAFDAILADYEKACALAPQNPMFRGRLAMFLMENSKYDRAEQVYNEAAAADPESASEYYSEFATEFYRSIMDRIGEDGPKNVAEFATHKALTYFLKAMSIDSEYAAKLLSGPAPQVNLQQELTKLALEGGKDEGGDE